MKKTSCHTLGYQVNSTSKGQADYMAAYLTMSQVFTEHRTVRGMVLNRYPADQRVAIAPMVYVLGKTRSSLSVLGHSDPLGIGHPVSYMAPGVRASV